MVRLYKWFFIVVMLAIVGFALWTWGALTFVYSTGERSGYVQKLSKKGWLVKTWEGELAMVNLPGSMQEKFYFTVRDDAVAKRLESIMGRHVVITYEEHRGIPTQLFGETSHFIVDVRPANLPTPQ